MKNQIKEGDTIERDGQQWKVTEISEDNEGQVVYHLKAGDKVNVVKESELPANFKPVSQATK